MKPHYLLFFALVLLFSCQTEIEVKVPDYYNKIVVEGIIQNGEYPMVSLYRSVPYFSKMSMNYLRDSVIITDAKVFVTSSKGDSMQLSLTLSDQAPLFFAYSGYSFKGELNTSYKLRIEWNDKIYTSETRIENTFDLDSAFFVPPFGEDKIDSAANLRIAMRDDGAANNYYQFKVKVRSKDKLKDYPYPFPDRLWVVAIPAAFDNSPFRGVSFNYEIVRGTPSSILMPEMDREERRNYFRSDYRVGDTVYLQYARLDEPGFRFWNSATGEITFGQNPFMSPTPIVSNIKCNTGEKCLGVWYGSAAQEQVLILDAATAKSPAATRRIR